MAKFDGKVVLVTGGGTGIGKAIAEAFLREGAQVAVTGRREAPLAALAQEYQGRVLALSADITRAEDRRRVIEGVRARYGRLDVLVNNAGAYVAKPLIETTDEEAERVLGLNLVALIAITRDALPLLTAARGNVLNVSSVVATGVMPGTSVYSASKAAVDHFTRLLAAELGGAGVRVNALSPGLTVTDMSEPLTSDEQTTAQIVAQTPLGRLGQPVDIARVAAFLASDEAGWVTGQVVASSGGLLL